MEDTRKMLSKNTGILIDRKSQIITIAVTDESAQRAAEIGQAYIEGLNGRLAEVSTSAARRERIFLEDRLKSVNQDLETAEKEFSRFSSKNSAIDIKEQGKAMVEVDHQSLSRSTERCPGLLSPVEGIHASNFRAASWPPASAAHEPRDLDTDLL